METTPHINWYALQFNTQNFEDTNENTFLEGHIQQGNKTKVHQFKWGLKDSKDVSLESWLSSKKKLKGSLVFEDLKEADLPLFLHSQFEGIRNQLVECGKREATITFTPQDESQGKEWLRVSLELLKEALATVRKEREGGGPEVLSGLLFCGTHPNNGKFIFRLRLFNLDIDIEEDKENNLRCLVLNKKQNDTFQGLEPSLTMVFQKEKNEILNYLIKLLPYIAEGLL